MLLYNYLNMVLFIENILYVKQQQMLIE